MNKNSHIDPIDVVITWVDGQDPKHQEKRAQYQSLLTNTEDEATAPTRFNQFGELSYCVLSILRYAPWVRTIFIVTDNQIPPIYQKLQSLPEGKKLKLIDHQTIFQGFQKYLPTFNSLTIESMIWRIPGLSERFIYFNDDCLLLQPISPEDFFKNGNIVIRGKWKTQSDKRLQTRITRLFSKSPKIAAPHRQILEKTAKIAGLKKYFLHLDHTPFALRTSTFKESFSTFPEEWQQNIQYRFRSEKQFFPISFIQHIDWLNQKAIMDKRLKSITVNGAHHSKQKVKQRIEHQPKATFLCIQSLDSTPKDVQSWMIQWLEDKFQEVNRK